MIVAGDYVMLNTTLLPAQAVINAITVADWQKIFAAHGGKMKVDSVVRDNLQIIDTNYARAGYWIINCHYVRPVEYTVNKLGNFPKRTDIKTITGGAEHE